MTRPFAPVLNPGICILLNGQIRGLSVPGKGTPLQRPARMVDAPDQRGKSTAADQVPCCDRQQILEEEAAPGQRFYRNADLPRQLRICLLYTSDAADD